MFKGALVKALGLMALAGFAIAAPAAQSYGPAPGKPPHPNSTYPSKATINSIFQNLHNDQITNFAGYIDPNVIWTVEGTHPLAGTYHGSQDFITHTLEYLAKISSKTNPIVISVVNIIGGGDEEWSAVELSAEGQLLNGMQAHIRVTVRRSIANRLRRIQFRCQVFMEHKVEPRSQLQDCRGTRVP